MQSRLSRDWYAHLRLNPKSTGLIQKIMPRHRHNSVVFWNRPRNRDFLFARIDFCKDLRNRIVHLEPVWKAGPLMTEGRARVERKIRVERFAPSNPVEALARLQIAYDRVLELLKWLSPGLHEVYLAGEAHHRFESLNRVAALDACKRHGGHRRMASVNLNAYRSLQRLKKELRGIGRHHGAAEVRHDGGHLPGGFRWSSTPYKTFPGFSSPCGSSAALIARIDSMSFSERVKCRKCFFFVPIPCSADIDPWKSRVMS